MSTTRNYNKEFCDLYEIMCEEISDLNLKKAEIRECFFSIVGLIFKPRLDTSHPNLTTEMFVSPDNCNIATIKAFYAAYNNKDISEINLTLSEYNICNNQRLSKILSRFLEKNTLPPYDISTCKDYMMNIKNCNWLKSLIHEKASTRKREVINGSITWSIVSYSGKSKTIPEASYIWGEKEGMCRFITKDGRWGYIDTYTLEYFLLAYNIVNANDFSNYRALVFTSNEFAQEIDINDSFMVDYNPYKLCWAHIDMRGNIIKKYTKATEYKDNVAIVNLEDGDWWGFMDKIQAKYENPYKNIKVDIFGNPLPKYQQNIDDTNRKIEKEKRHKEFMRDIFRPDYDDEETIMRALRNGYGDEFGY